MQYTWKLSSLVLKRRREGSNYFGNLKETALSGGKHQAENAALVPKGSHTENSVLCSCPPAEAESP